MATGSLRREVLQSFKVIHRTRCLTFQGDKTALECARQEINKNYKKNKKEINEEKIKDLIKFAYDVIHELKTSVLQFRQLDSGRLQAQFRPEMFDDSPIRKKNQQNSEIGDKIV